MMRTFEHSFSPPTANPVSGATVELEAAEIEDAGIREVLQTPGAGYGAWSILDTLLASTGPGTPFVFKEPLGQAREVKVALSGLFGRFVARAYLTRYFNLSVFDHVAIGTQFLDRRQSVKIDRVSRGDLPDWIACDAGLSSLTVAEAKGCHDPSGPLKARARAWAQAKRIDVVVKNKKFPVKRIAIATRWGNISKGPKDAHLSARDPDEGGGAITPEEKDVVFIAVLRQHIANLIAPLGHAELALALRRLGQGFRPRDLESEMAAAEATLDTADARNINGVAIDGLVGGIVTRAGPLAETATQADERVLARLDLRPVFVGVERDLIRAAIKGNAKAVRERAATIKREGDARPDRAGGWIVPLGQGSRATRGT